MNAQSHDQAAAPEEGRSRMGMWIALAVIALLVFVWLQRQSSRQHHDQHPAIGQKPERLELTPLLGEAPAISSPDDVAGQVVLINYWGPWCYYCKQEFPHLVELHEELGHRGEFRLLAVSCDGRWQPDAPPQLQWRENVPQLREDTQAYLDRLSTDMPIYVDVRGASRTSLAQLLPWQGYPTTVILDRAGAIRGVWVGYREGDEQIMRRLIEQLLKEQSA